MSISMAISRLPQPLINIPPNGQKMDITIPQQKDKVVLIIGATGTGKSRLSVDLASRFWPAEIINSDKMQVYEGLDIVTNKITMEEQRGVTHHLLGTQNPNSEFTANHFCETASFALESITDSGHLPIIVGGSNSYIQALIDDNKFRSRYELCCLWMDVSMPDLHSYVEQRVDQMLDNGMMDELRPFFNPNGDYSRGIRKSIGVPEFDQYFRSEAFGDEETRRRLLREAISEMKENTCKLAVKQLGKIHRLRSVKRWKIHRIDATPVFRKQGKEANETWEELVAEPSALIVAQFLLLDSAAAQIPASVVSGFRLPAFGRALATTMTAWE